MPEPDDGITMTLDLSFEVFGQTLDELVPLITARLEKFAPRSVWAVRTDVGEHVVSRAQSGETIAWQYSASVQARYGGPLLDPATRAEPFPRRESQLS